MRWIKARFSAVHEALGPRRYMLAPLFGAIVGFVDWVVSKLEDIGLGGLIGVPSWAIGVFVTILIVAWFLLEQIVKLRKKLTPSLSVSYDDKAPDCHKAVYESAD